MDLPLLLNVITSAAVVIGVIFGLFELRQALKSRRDLVCPAVRRSAWVVE